MILWYEFIPEDIFCFLGLTFNGIRLAYQYYLKSRLQRQEKSKKLRLKRSHLSTVLQQISSTEMIASDRMVRQFEFQRTIKQLQKQFEETLEVGRFAAYFGQVLDDDRLDYIARREVSILSSIFYIYFLCSE